MVGYKIINFLTNTQKKSVDVISRLESGLIAAIINIHFLPS